MKPKLRFMGNRIQEIEARYDYSISEVELLELRPKVQNRGYVSKEELQKIAQTNHVDMRTLDRALWQYSKGALGTLVYKLI